MDLYLQAVTQQATDRTDQATPDLETYIALRRDTSACRPCFALMEFVAGVDLPDDAASHPTILAMEEATNDLVSWSNVKISYPCATDNIADRIYSIGYLLIQCRAIAS